MDRYEELMTSLANGWNTWDTSNTLAHVLLPEGFSLNVSVKDAFSSYQRKRMQFEPYNWQANESSRPSLHTYGGGYTEMFVTWKGVCSRVQTATEGEDLVILVSPTGDERKSYIFIESGLLWNRPGHIEFQDGVIVASLPGKEIRVFPAQEHLPGLFLDTQTPHLAFLLDRPGGVSTGRRRSVSEISDIIESARSAHVESKDKYGEHADAYQAMQTGMAWNTIYHESENLVITPVSRSWNITHDGYVLFEWDTFFAAYMASLDSKELAYANALTITRTVRRYGYVPDAINGYGASFIPFSQPPVGSLICLELYRKFRDKWFLEEVFDDLLTWNRWRAQTRQRDGYVCWGWNPPPASEQLLHSVSTDDRKSRAPCLESGLDNSPMYDDATFDEETCTCSFADVGLMGLYVMDCDKLATIARLLGRNAEAQELDERADRFRTKLRSMWDDEAGTYLNVRLDTGEKQYRYAPTMFYPLLANAPTAQQAERMMKEHFYNPEEFWGEWILPSIARNDPAYPDQDYWRGRIWGPMNLLVYMGLCNYDLPEARRALAEKSEKLLLKEWHEMGHVHENYSADTGAGCDKESSVPLYHWGGLLCLIPMIEDNFLPAPGESID
ncbi:MAG: hypothetical protein J7M08_02115 [Planctomycetes bacterium]|nr:hypothetical protein [Planctomycetota bacterium]